MAQKGWNMFLLIPSPISPFLWPMGGTLKLPTSPQLFSYRIWWQFKLLTSGEIASDLILNHLWNQIDETKAGKPRFNYSIFYSTCTSWLLHTDKQVYQKILPSPFLVNCKKNKWFHNDLPGIKYYFFLTCFEYFFKVS